MRNPVTWFEIIGTDAAALQKFYREVFNWKLTPPVADMGYYSMLSDQKPGDRGAGGGIGGALPGGTNRVTVYVEVDDPQRYLDRATRGGAETLMPVSQITPDTTIAMFRDPAGNTIGILKANPVRPAPEAAARTASRGQRARTAGGGGTTKRRRAAGSTTRKAGRTTRRAKRR